MQARPEGDALPGTGLAPEDFIVEEIPLYRPSGEGEHTFVRVEKRLRNSEGVRRELARLAGVPPAAVGYAGRKDRVAIARQWFSVPGLDPQRALALEGEGIRVLEAVRHPHKLRTGQLRGNRFELTLRDLSAPGRVAAALAEMVSRGMPNRFGAQRFGSDGGNAARARALLEGAPVGRSRSQARFLFSALQAEVFNAVLTARPLPLDRLETGDIAWLHSSGASFLVEDAQREASRATAFEISATGPIFGSRALEPRGAPGERERAVYQSLGLPSRETLRPPRGIRLRGARRPLRVRPEAASCECLGDGVVRLSFTLPPGSYATVLVEELLG
jgi:tRNA pseudouridine13 synthase